MWRIHKATVVTNHQNSRILRHPILDDKKMSAFPNAASNCWEINSGLLRNAPPKDFLNRLYR